MNGTTAGELIACLAEMTRAGFFVGFAFRTEEEEGPFLTGKAYSEQHGDYTATSRDPLLSAEDPNESGLAWAKAYHAVIGSLFVQTQKYRRRT